MGRLSLYVLALIALYTTSARAHAHHNVTEIDTAVPFDGKIYFHMTLQTFLWGISFPIGMVLGLSKSKYHVPLQSMNTVLVFVGTYFGHHHGGRQFPATVHGLMAKIILWILVTQAGCGIFLKLHIMEKSVRPWIVRVHGFLGKLFPLLGWVPGDWCLFIGMAPEMLFGVATALGFCRGGNLGQCAAHYIMGSAFIGYGAILVLMLTVGGKWLERRGCSQEMLDSSVITAWGIVNTFTEHHGGPWSHKDMQHTMMGVLWWAGGMLGMFLSRGGKRSFIPAFIIILTGWGMSAHEQALMISSKIHALFGYALMGAGVARIIEVCFVLNDNPTPPGTIRIFQHLPPITLFMSATDEEMHNADGLGIDHVTYALFDFSLSFLIYLIITFLVHLYSNTGRNASEASAEPANAEEAGYSKLTNGEASRRLDDLDGPEAYEMTEQEESGEEDAVKIGGEDGVDWMGGHRAENGVRL